MPRRQPSNPTLAPQRPRGAEGAAGFTLVEILVVVLILAVLAAIVIPRFTSATEQGRDSTLRMDLSRVRQALEVYKQEHNGEYPTDASTLTAQLTQKTDASGDTAAPNPHFGPYFQRMPKNPFNESATVSDTPLEPDTGWYYADGVFKANNSPEHHDL